MSRQSATQFAAAYGRIKADLQATEGGKVAEFNRKRAGARQVEHEPSRRERHRAESNRHHQQGAP